MAIDTVADSGRVGFGFSCCFGLLRAVFVLLWPRENGSFAVLIEMPDSVVAGDTRDLVPAQSLSEADTDDVVRMVLMILFCLTRLVALWILWVLRMMMV